MGIISNSLFALGVINGIKPIETKTKAAYFSFTFPTYTFWAYSHFKDMKELQLTRRPVLYAGLYSATVSILVNGSLFCMGTLMGKSISRASKDLL